MRTVLHIAANDLRLTLRDRASFFWMLVLPLALMWVFGSVMRGSSGPPTFTLTVVDRDGGWLARSLIDSLDGGRADLEEIPPEEAATREDKVRTLVIPEGFTASVLAGEKQVLRIEKDAESSEDYGVAAEFHVLRVGVRTLARLIELSQKGILGEGDAMRPEVAEAFRRLDDREPLVRLETSTAGEGRPVPSGTAQSVPGILSMTVLMMTVIYGGVFLTLEKRSGTLRRQLMGPTGRARVFAGKLAGRFLLAVVQAIVLLAAGRFLYGLSYGSSPLALALLLACYALAVAGLATLLGAVLRTPEQAASVGWLSSMVMAALGGCWWPSEVVPRWLWKASHVLPTAWAMDGFHALISFGRGLEGVWLPSLALLAFAAVFSATGAALLRYEAGGD